MDSRVLLVNTTSSSRPRCNVTSLSCVCTVWNQAKPRDLALLPRLQPRKTTRRPPLCSTPLTITMSHAAAESGASRNPFLSPTHTGSSQAPPHQQALPNLHTAFEGLDVSSDIHPSVTDSNLITSSQSSSRNPFLEPSHTGASRLSAREVEELEDLSSPPPWPRKEEGTDEPVVSRGGASSPWGIHDDATATSSWPASSSAGEGSVSGSGGGVGRNDPFEGTSSLTFTNQPAIDYAAIQAEQFAGPSRCLATCLAEVYLIQYMLQMTMLPSKPPSQPPSATRRQMPRLHRRRATRSSLQRAPLQPSQIVGLRTLRPSLTISRMRGRKNFLTPHRILLQRTQPLRA